MAKSKLVTERGPAMNTSAGQKVYPFDPRAAEININSVAHHLANANRWNGATQHKKFSSRISFSVAEHSVLCARFMVEVLNRPDLELEALLHDAPEYMYGDLIQPVKHHPSIHKIIKPLEDRADEAFAERFDLVMPFPPEIKIADKAVCAAEFRQIVPHESDDPSDMLREDTLVAPYEIEMMSAFDAKQYFLAAFNVAMARRGKYVNPKR